MTTPSNPFTLTVHQQGQVLGVLSVGCDRQTAAGCVGCTVDQFTQALEADPAFARSVLKQEASVELAHMQNIFAVVKEKRDWRASVWWLEQRAPDRFAHRTPGSVTTRQLKAFLDQLGKGLVDDIRSEADRERAIARLQCNHQAIDLLIDELLSSQIQLDPSPLLLEYAASPSVQPSTADTSCNTGTDSTL